MTEPLHAPAYTATALAQREQFIRSAAEAWRRAGDTCSAERLSVAADGLAERLNGFGREAWQSLPSLTRDMPPADESVAHQIGNETSAVRLICEQPLKPSEPGGSRRYGGTEARATPSGLTVNRECPIHVEGY